MAASSSGAVPIINEKGERSMQRVKVERYVSGKKPKFAPDESSSDEDLFDLDEECETIRDDDTKDEEEERVLIYHEPPKLPDGQDQVCDDPRLAKLKKITNKHITAHSIRSRSYNRPLNDEDSQHADGFQHEHLNDDDDDSDADIRRRHAMARTRKKPTTTVDSDTAQTNEQKLHDLSGPQSESDDESEDSEGSVEEDELGPRLMPIFVPKGNRQICNEQLIYQEEQDKEIERRKLAEERRMQTLGMIEQEIRRQQAEESEQIDHEVTKASIESINTDDEEDGELAYEEWKLRELKRIQRDREEKEKLRQEREEALKIRNMSEEARQSYLARNPKEKVNDMPKGKMKYLQRYYHRGAFYLDEDSDVFKRDFQQPTLEDRQDKTDLPHAMQVKNFGRSGRTKYTHLADQDTTKFDNPWASMNSINKKFYQTKAGGLKDYDKKQ